jgi:hypothetical protein
LARAGGPNTAHNSVEVLPTFSTVLKTCSRFKKNLLIVIGIKPVLKWSIVTQADLKSWSKKDPQKRVKYFLKNRKNGLISSVRLIRSIRLVIPYNAFLTLFSPQKS